MPKLKLVLGLVVIVEGNVTKRRVDALVNTVVWGIWIVIAASSGSWWPWPVFVTLFWGIGLVMNAWEVYFRKPITEAEMTLVRFLRRIGIGPDEAIARLAVPSS